jgi:hypothetical protein
LAAGGDSFSIFAFLLMWMERNDRSGHAWQIHAALTREIGPEKRLRTDPMVWRLLTEIICFFLLPFTLVTLFP